MQKNIGPLIYVFKESIRNVIVPGKLIIAMVYLIYEKEFRMKIGDYS